MEYNIWDDWAQWLRLVLSNGDNRVGVSHTLNRSSFQNFVFFRTIDCGQRLKKPVFPNGC
jgi:hypothetical protein